MALNPRIRPSAINELIEQRIREAQAKGEFENLPGQGKPLPIEDNALVPYELRVAHRMLKNAGFVPPEVEALRKVSELRARRQAGSDEPSATDDEARAQRRLLALSLALEKAGLPLSVQVAIQYRQAMLGKLK